MNKIKAPAGAGAMVKLALAGGALWFGATNTLYNVEGGHRAIVFNRFEGIKDKVYPEGTHLIIPLIERPIIYDVRARPNLVESTSGSRDLQMVTFASPDPEYCCANSQCFGAKSACQVHVWFGTTDPSQGVCSPAITTDIRIKRLGIWTDGYGLLHV
ncbi:prohibitin-1, mitochondrial-like [Lolium rigidum]|uniref:prohibitin-1, mitochondrial-like n=1 Tax=Lolium rigidum TaxID=89674 RepID=UPI001F5C69C6|nr:prohibitin-1, mitochondrial-like [Lolium rigidum]